MPVIVWHGNYAMSKKNTVLGLHYYHANPMMNNEGDKTVLEKNYKLAKELFFSSSDIKEIRSRIERSEYQTIWAGIQETADKMCDEQSILLAEDTFTIWYYVRNRLMDLALVSMVTEEEKYVKTLKMILRDLCTRDMDFWQGPEYPNRPRTRNYHGKDILAGELETAQLAMGVSVAYDWAYPLLDQEERTLILTCLKEKAQMLLRNSTMFQSEHWVMNHLCVIASAMSLTTIILEDEGIPFAEDMALVQKGLNLWMKKIETDGSYGESFHYWAYPINCLFFSVYALKHAKNIEMEGTKWVDRNFEWAFYNQVGKYEIEGYDRPVAIAVNSYDCPYLFQMEGPEGLLFANYFKNPLAQWYVNRYLMGGLSRPDSLHRVWHECNSLLFALHDSKLPERSPESIGLPTTRIFHDTGFVYIRDSWDNYDKIGGDTVFQLQSGGGGRSRSHEHYDKNSFSLYAKGEYFIVDPGHSCYRGKAHDDYDTRTKSHNTITVDGKDQNLGFVEKGMLHDEVRKYTSYHNRAEIVGHSFQEELTYVASDARRSYEPYLKEFVRRVWFVKPGYFLIWDRVDIGAQPGGIQSGFNLNNRDGKLNYQIDQGTVRISRPKADLFMQFITPEELTIEVTDGKLHEAYHIFTDQPIEGKQGTVKRINVGVANKELKTADFLYIICPTDKGGETPQALVLEKESEVGLPHRFKTLTLQVEYQGNKDTFHFNADDVKYERENGAFYTF